MYLVITSGVVVYSTSDQRVADAYAHAMRRKGYSCRVVFNRNYH